MRKKACLIALIGVLLFSWQVSAANFGFAGGLGLTKMDEDFYLTTSLYPDVAIGKLGVGMELTLNVSKDGIRKEDWQDWGKVLARSIRYVRWAHKGAPLYLQFGTLLSNNMGTGILVSNYSNRTSDDVASGTRKLGLVADVNFGVGGVETLVNDTVNPNLMAGRVFVNPLKLVGVGILSRLSTGVSFAVDKRNTAPFTGLQGRAFDVMYPVSTALVFYAHAATLSDDTGALGSGKGAGVQGRLGPIKYVAEVRQLDQGFVASPFSKGYEEFGTPTGGEATEGYLLGADLELSRGNFVMGLRQEFNALAEQEPTLSGILVAKGDFMKSLIGREAELSADYTKKIVFGQKTNGYLKAGLKVEMLRGTYLSCEYDAVIAPDGNVRSKTTGGMLFNPF